MNKQNESSTNTVQHKIETLDKEMVKLQASIDSKDREISKFLKKEKALFIQLTDSDTKCRRFEKKYELSKVQIKEYEDSIIQKDEQIKFMEMQKKNEDLCSKIENNFPDNRHNDLNELEDMNG